MLSFESVTVIRTHAANEDQITNVFFSFLTPFFNKMSKSYWDQIYCLFLFSFEYISKKGLAYLHIMVCFFLKKTSDIFGVGYYCQYYSPNRVKGYQTFPSASLNRAESLSLFGVSELTFAENHHWFWVATVSKTACEVLGFLLECIWKGDLADEFKTLSLLFAPPSFLTRPSLFIHPAGFTIKTPNILKPHNALCCSFSHSLQIVY